MTLIDALKLLGLPEQGFDREQAERAWRDQREGLVQQLVRAPTPVLREKLEERLRQLDLAHGLVQDLPVMGETSVGSSPVAAGIGGPRSLLVADRYEVGEVLWSGTRSDLGLGLDRLRQEPVLLRLWKRSPEGGEQSDLEKAADLWSSLAHPSLSRVRDLVTENGLPVLVLDGGARVVPCSKEQADLPLALSQGLAELHRRGLSHGRVCPDLLWNIDGRLKLLPPVGIDRDSYRDFCDAQLEGAAQDREALRRMESQLGPGGTSESPAVADPPRHKETAVTPGAASKRGISLPSAKQWAAAGGAVVLALAISSPWLRAMVKVHDYVNRLDEVRLENLGPDSLRLRNDSVALSLWGQGRALRLRLKGLSRTMAMDSSEELFRQALEDLDSARGRIEGTRSRGMLAIPAGCFLMGSSDSDIWMANTKPIHHVCLDAFRMDTTEVTNAAFAAWAKTSGDSGAHYQDGTCWILADTVWRKDKAPGVFTAQDVPVSCVNWQQASAYCQAQGKRLPTEAEWEYAARAGTTTRWFWGNVRDSGCLYANGADADYLKIHPSDTSEKFGCHDGYREIAPVAKFRPNHWGLYDMVGNVNHWTADWFGSYPTGEQQNPTGPSSGSYRMRRGGGWHNDPVCLRSAFRIGYLPDSRSVGLGFRCAGP